MSLTDVTNMVKKPGYIRSNLVAPTVALGMQVPGTGKQITDLAALAYRPCEEPVWRRYRNAV